jgi:NADH-quinone oxidoreductase subunit L
MERLKMSEIVVWAGIVTILIARISAFYEKDIKKIVALSTLRQLGLMFLMLGVGLYELAFVHLLVHAFFKATIFVVVGNSIHLSSDYQDLRCVRINNRVYPISFRFLLLTNLSLMAFPFLGRFYSKDLFLECCLIIEYSWARWVILLCSVVFTVAYRVRLIKVILFYPVKQQVSVSTFESRVEVSVSLTVLIFLVVLRGRVFSVISMRSTVLLVPGEFKIVVFIIIFLGVVRGLFLKEEYKVFGHSLGSIFRLPYLRGGVNIIILKFSSYLYVLDLTWSV